MDKERGKKHFRQVFKKLGHLDRGEIEELIRFEFEKEASGLTEQVRRYYLKLKSEDPEVAERLFEEIQALGNIEDDPQKSTLEVYDVLKKYISGFRIIG